jgi:hypothetical protein
MEGIQAVVFLVRCTDSLMLCQDLPSEHLHFSSMATCQTNLPYLVEEARTLGVDGSVVMAKCHYLLMKHIRHDKIRSLKKSYQLSGGLNE